MATLDPDSRWNTDVKISCEFSFKCPTQWDRLQPTVVEGVRHCAECDRDMHLALTEEDFRQYADEGQCVAVRVLQSNHSAERSREVCIVGYAIVPYNSHLKPF